MESLPTQYQASQLQLQRSAAAQAAELWGSLQIEETTDNAPLWSLAVLEKIVENRNHSYVDTQAFYNAMRAAVGEGEFFVHQSPTDINKTIQRLLATGPLRVRMLVKAGMSLRDAKAEALTLHQAVVADESVQTGKDFLGTAIHEDRVAVGYARVPKPNACAFCIMLASRGAVYSKDTVLKTTGRSKFGAGKSYHPNCGCTMTPVFSHDQKLPTMVASAEQEWHFHTDGVPTREQLKIFRAASGRR